MGNIKHFIIDQWQWEYINKNYPQITNNCHCFWNYQLNSKDLQMKFQYYYLMH